MKLFLFQTPTMAYTVAQKFIKYQMLGQFTASTVYALNIFDAGFCGTNTGIYSGLIYTIYDVDDKVTLQTCHDDTGFDITAHVFHDTI